MDDNLGTELKETPTDCGFLHLAHRLEMLARPDSKPDMPDSRPGMPGRIAPESVDFVNRFRAQLIHPQRWFATIQSLIHNIEKCKQYLVLRDPRDLEGEAILRWMKLPMEIAVTKFATEFEKCIDKLVERKKRGFEYPGAEHYSPELCQILQRAIGMAANKAERLYDGAERLEIEAADADTTRVTVPAHPSEIGSNDEQPVKNIQAEWWISTENGSLFFRTFSDEVLDGVAEFKCGTKIHSIMALLCERGDRGINVPEILGAAYPEDLKQLQQILNEAPRDCAKDVLFDYYKNAGVQKIVKRAKQINHTVRKKLHMNGIPGEVLEILPGLEVPIFKNPSAPVVFLRVQRLEKKRLSGFKISPRIVRASGAGEYTEDPSRPHLL